jgi:hypothetical protein
LQPSGLLQEQAVAQSGEALQRLQAALGQIGFSIADRPSYGR